MKNIKKKEIIYDIRLFLNKITAIVIIVIGFHFMDASASKKALPFGISTTDIYILEVWEHIGCFIGLFTIIFGLSLIFKKISYEIDDELTDN